MAREFRFTILLVLAIVFLSVDRATEFVADQIMLLFRIETLGLFNFLKENLSDLLVILIITFFVDLRLHKDSIVLKTSDITAARGFIDELKQLTSSGAAIEFHLKKIYGDNIRGIGNIVNPNKTIYRDAFVRIRLVQHADDKGRFLYTQEVDFVTDSDKLIIVIVATSDQQDNLFNVDFVDEVFCLAKKGMTRDDAVRYASGVSLSVFEDNERGFLTERNVLLKLASRSMAQRCYALSSTNELDGVYVFQADVKSAFSSKKRVRIIYPDAVFRKDIPFVYWISDRPIYLKEIEIDATRFGDAARITVMPFVASYASSKRLKDVDAHREPIKLMVDAWCTYGQGVLISWRNQ
ncbi:MAG: hypothetical protein ACFE0R_00015 [Salinarimonas sp.]